MPGLASCTLRCTYRFLQLPAAAPAADSRSAGSSRKPSGGNSSKCKAGCAVLADLTACQQISTVAGDVAKLAPWCNTASAPDTDLECRLPGLTPAASLGARESSAQPQQEPAAARSPRARRPPKVYEDVRARRPVSARPAALAVKDPAHKVEAAGGSAAEGEGSDARVPDRGADAGQERALQQETGCPGGLSDPAYVAEFVVQCVPTAVGSTAAGGAASQARFTATDAVAAEEPAAEQAAAEQTVFEGSKAAGQPVAADRIDGQPAVALGVGQKRKRDAHDSMTAANAHPPVRLRV